MIIIAGTVKINPANRAQALEAAKAMCEASEAEVGCLRYQIYAHPQNEDEFFVFEEWASEAALQAHFTTPHMKTFNQQLEKIGVQQMAIKRYEVSQVTDL